jgi:hypothetical protein
LNICNTRTSSTATTSTSMFPLFPYSPDPPVSAIFLHGNFRAILISHTNPLLKGSSAAKLHLFPFTLHHLHILVPSFALTGMTPLWQSLPVRWSSLRKFASRSNGSADLDLELARSWLKDLHPNTIPRHIAHLSFSRSSGPGGQNVNKSVQPRGPLLLLPLLPVPCYPCSILVLPYTVLVETC